MAGVARGEQSAGPRPVVPSMHTALRGSECDSRQCGHSLI